MFIQAETSHGSFANTSPRKVDHEDSRSVRLGIGYSGLRSAEYDRPQRHAPGGLPEF